MRVLPALDRRLFSIALTNASLLLLEVALSREVNYVANDRTITAFPMVVFAGIGLGAILGLTPLLRSLTPSRLLLIASSAAFVAFYMLAKMDGAALIAVVLATSAFGIFFSRSLSEVPLQTVVWGFGIAGVLLYGAVNGLIGLSERSIALQIVVALAIAASIAESTFKVTVPAITLCVAAAIASRAGAFDPVSRLSRMSAFVRDGVPVRAPIYTALFRTDLLRYHDSYIIVTNGSRWAFVTTNPEDLSGRRHGAAAPFALGDRKRVLVIGAAGGNNVSGALMNGAEHVTAVDINPAVMQLMKTDMAQQSRGIYLDPRVTAVAAEGRHFTETSNETFDLITLHGVQTGTTSDFIQPAVLESFLFTEESLVTLWNHLTPTGVLFFDEYERTRTIDGKEVSLLASIALSARRLLGIDDFPSHMIHGRYKRPEFGREGERARETLFLSKVPIEPGPRRQATKLFTQGEDPDLPDVDPMHARIEDDHPFFIDDRAEATSSTSTSFGIIMAIVAVIAAFVTTRTKKLGTPALILFATGMGYITLVSAFMGPATLILGQPELTTPVVFIAVSVWALAGGIVALRIKPRAVQIGVGALVVYLVLFVIVLPVIKTHLVSLPSLTTRSLVVFLMMMPAALLAELPYIALLGRYEGTDRGFAYVMENLGTLFGMVVCIALEMTFGFTAAILSSAAAYLVALFGFFAQRGGPPQPAVGPL